MRYLRFDTRYLFNNNIKQAVKSGNDYETSRLKNN